MWLNERRHLEKNINLMYNFDGEHWIFHSSNNEKKI
jgi:hypothetical protein